MACYLSTLQRTAYVSPRDTPLSIVECGKMSVMSKCRHDNLRGIYGDEINAVNGKRSECLNCHTLFPELPRKNDGNTSDGYHTFNELYDHRMALTVALMKLMPAISWRSRVHHPDDAPMFDGYFVVGMTLPTGEITYHYKNEYWDKFEGIGHRKPQFVPKWDGHTPQDVVDRLNAWSADLLKRS